MRGSLSAARFFLRLSPPTARHPCQRRASGVGTDGARQGGSRRKKSGGRQGQVMLSPAQKLDVYRASRRSHSAVGKSAVGSSAVGKSAVGSSAVGSSAVGKSAVGSSAV